MREAAVVDMFCDFCVYGICNDVEVGLCNMI